MHKRNTLLRLLAAAATLACAGQVHAQATPGWPNGPVRLITPTPVGVGADAFARLYADRLAKLLSAPVVVENRPGASSTLATDAVAKSPANGQVFLFSTSLPITTVPHLMAKLPYNPEKDLVPVAALFRGGSFIVASPAFSGKSLKDLVSIAKAKPGSINYATYGPASTANLGMELLQDAAGIEMVQIAYKQSAMPDLMGGQLDVGWEPASSALPNVRSGKLRALAYTGDKRSPTLPDVPALSEIYPGLELFTTIAVWAPAGTPAPVLERMRKAFEAASKDPQVVSALHETGNEVLSITPAQMQANLARESQSMERLIKAKKIAIN
ncbi:tripartite-type tricarboxylate transporter receptor subunit TctC [Acidovorax soli]|uniref:Tripartite-type tricarboxylate transporter receptor subunit TctC n=1 Tax=Acidovorax soli TaxID=592050 RepID=A0A7X0PD80_9BURK|nr:tripartite tricarboxylate transporter substrate-binding protein [Acidovorax soli]MBB6559760.1 tripartite-type tricarboxylate transporter receptor subunit TctC [Acidovorax soli]